MDKQEYKILSEEIMTLVANEQFVDAAAIADRIDWRKVRSFSTLQKISELYRINRRFDDAMDIMLLAYERNSNSRTIVYSLCELAVDLNDIVLAAQYLAMYKRMAPNDKGSLILQYKILEMQNAKTEDKIELLEELNRKDYTEEWAYQLAYLYHRIGLATKCVETCDQLITWFGYGPFVIKAIELKMLHAPLTDKQKEIYEGRNAISDQIEAYESDEYTVERAESAVAAEMGVEDFHVKTIDMGKFNTLNLQKALAESMRELMGDDSETDESPLATTGELEQKMESFATENHSMEEDSYNYDQDEPVYEEGYPEDDYHYEEEVYENEPYEEESYNEEIYNEETYNEESYSEESYAEDTYVEDSQDEESYAEEPYIEESYMEESSADDVVTGDTQRIDVIDVDNSVENEVFFDDKTGDIIMDQPPVGTNLSMLAGKNLQAEIDPQADAGMQEATGLQADDSLAYIAKSQNMQEVVHHKIEKNPSNSIFDNVLSQGLDGQISLVVPEETIVEKQITGQMNLQDVFNEWENVKKRKEQERRAKNNQSIIEQTGKIFADFEATSRTGPLARIEEESKIFSNRFKENEIELRPIDALEAPAAKGLIWDEVNAAIEADKKNTSEESTGDSVADFLGEAAMAGLAGAAMGATAMAATAANAAGTIAADAVAGAGMEAAGIAGEVAADAAMAAAETIADTTVTTAEVEEAEVPTDSYSETVENTEYFAEEPQDVFVDNAEEQYPEEEELSAYGQAASDILNDNNEEVYESYEEPAVAEVTEEPVNAGESVNEQILDTSQIDNIGNVLEAEADKVGADTAEEDNDNYEENEDHYLTVEEQNLFADFMYSKKMRGQILDAIDQISLAPYVGNVIITGDSGTGVIELAKTMVKEIQMIDNNFSASRVAKISGDKMNRKDIAAMFEQLANGALIIEKAGAMTKDTLENMTRILEGCQEGIIIIMTDTKKDMEKLIQKYDLITGYFNARIDIKPMNDNALVDYAKKYAYTREYKIDEERAVLALHRRINDLQIGEHNVTVREIEDIIDEAIDRSKRLRLSTYIDILVGKRYDYEDMIILKEKDFD